MGKKILIIDDDFDYATILTELLHQQGYAVVVAHSRAEGLQKLLAEKPDLLIVDVVLESDTAGFELIYQVRSTRPTSRYRAFQKMPIIVLTSITALTNSHFSLDENQSFLPPVQEFLTKPVNNDELVARIKKHVLAA